MKLPMPGISALISHMLSGDGHKFYQDLCKSCRLSNVRIPKEACTDWVDIQIWGNKSQYKKAEKPLLDRMEPFFRKAREVVPVDPPLGGWNVARWEQQLEAWRLDSKASIIPFPYDWREEGSVSELWIFSESVGPQRYNHAKRDYAVKKIKEDIEQLRTNSEKQVADQQASEKSTAKKWSKYTDPSTNSIYFYCEDNGDWFYKNDKSRRSGWTQFLDESSNRHWWFNESKGQWFYEP